MDDLPPVLPDDEFDAPAGRPRILKEIVDRSSRAATSNLPMFIIVQYDHEADKASFLNALRHSLKEAELYVREFDPVHNAEHGVGKLYPLMARASAQGAVSLIFGLPREEGEIKADHEFIHYLNIYRDRIVSDTIRMILMLDARYAEQFIFSAGDLWDFRHATYWLERPVTGDSSFLLDRMEMQAGELPAVVADADEIREHIESVRPLIEQTESFGEKADLLLQLCKWLSRKNAFTVALEAALEGLHLIGDERLKTKADLELQTGFLFYRLNEFIDAKAHLKIALPIYCQIRDRLGKAHCLRTMGNIQVRQHDHSGAKASYDTALPIYREVRDCRGEAYCLSRMGTLQMWQNELSEAKSSYDAALLIFREIKDRQGEAFCLSWKGHLQVRQFDFAGAKSSYDAALQIFRDVKDCFNEAYCLKGMGDLQTQQADDFSEAKSSYDAALLIFREIKERRGEAFCLSSLGDLQTRRFDLSGARLFYNAALPIYREVRHRIGEAYCLRRLGDIQLEQDDLLGARSFYDIALSIYREIKNRQGETFCFMRQGRVMLKEGNTFDAFNRFTTSIKIFREIDSKFGEQLSLLYLSRTARLLSAFDQSLLISEKSLNINRQINELFCQSQNLEEQLQVLQSINEDNPALATLLLLSNILTEINAPDAPKYAAQLKEKKQQLTKEAFKEIEENAEAIRAAAIAEARERFEKTGKDLFEPPG